MDMKIEFRRRLIWQWSTICICCCCCFKRDQKQSHLLVNYWDIVFVWAALTKYYRLVTWWYFFLIVVEVGRPKIKHQQIQCLIRAYFLVYRWTSYHYNLTSWKKNKRIFWDLFYKCTNPITRTPLLVACLITSQRIRFQISSHLELDFNIYVLRGHKRSVHSIPPLA